MKREQQTEFPAGFFFLNNVTKQFDLLVFLSCQLPIIATKKKNEFQKIMNYVGYYESIVTFQLFLSRLPITAENAGIAAVVAC